MSSWPLGLRSPRPATTLMPVFVLAALHEAVQILRTHRTYAAALFLDVSRARSQLSTCITRGLA